MPEGPAATAAFRKTPAVGRLAWAAAGALVVSSPQDSCGNVHAQRRVRKDLFSSESSARLLFGNDTLRGGGGPGETQLDIAPAHKTVIFARSSARSDLWALSLGSGLTPHPYLKAPSFTRDAVFSPNGRWVAYTSQESGTPQVIVQPFPDGSAGKWPISAASGRIPRWARNGRELFYLDGQHRLVAVSVQTDGRFEAGRQVPLFTMPTSADGSVRPDVARSFDVSPDGSRFITSIDRSFANAADAVVPITVVVNWTAALLK